jgi:predicted GNAT family acetyltransferase
MSDTQSVLHEQKSNRGVFFIEDGGRRVAELTYRLGAVDAVVDHTWVDPKMRGGALGQSLVDAAVAWARQENRKIVPMCSYVRAVFSRTPAYADVHRH